MQHGIQKNQTFFATSTASEGVPDETLTEDKLRDIRRLVHDAIKNDPLKGGDTIQIHPETLSETERGPFIRTGINLKFSKIIPKGIIIASKGSEITAIINITSQLDETLSARTEVSMDSKELFYKGKNNNE